MKRIKEFNETLPAGHKKKQFSIANKKLYVDNVLHEQHIHPPKPLDIFVAKNEQDILDKIDFTISKPKTQDSSHFVGLATTAFSLEDVQRAYKKVRQLYPSYDHVMMGYRIDNFSGYQDDREHAAGQKIHALLVQKHCHNITAFVVRVFGGIHLGPQRFDCISTVADAAIEALILEHPEIIHQRQIIVVDPDISIPTPPIEDRLRNLAQEAQPE